MHLFDKQPASEFELGYAHSIEIDAIPAISCCRI